MNRKQVEELLDSSAHIVKIIKDDDLMFQDFPPLMRLKRAIETIAHAKMLDSINKMKSVCSLKIKD